MSKLIDIKGLSSKQKLLFFSICLVLLIIITTILMQFNFGTSTIDYKNSDFYSFIINSTESNDRDIYWTLNSIVYGYINTYQSKYNNDLKTLDDFYKSLDGDYKKYIGKKKYLELSNCIVKKVMGENIDVFSLIPSPLITTVYKLSDYDDAYICKLATVDNAQNTYVGIVLDTKNNKFNIFYLE